MSRDLARQAIGEKCILDAARELHDQTRTELAGDLEPGDRLQVGTLGMVYMTAPKGSWKITSPAAVLAWAREHAPHLIVTREEVPALPLDADGEFVLPDGESVRPDGVEWVVGGPVLTVKPTSEARAVARQQLRELGS